MYKIKYCYDSGDSFNSYPDNIDTLEIEWQTIEKAKENLNRIREHYEMYKALDSYYHKRPAEEIIEENKDKDWMVKKEILVAYKDNPENYHRIDEGRKEQSEKAGYKTRIVLDTSTAQNQIILYTEEGKPFQFWAPWCGYFESLNYAEIISPINSYKYEAQ